MLDHSYRTGSYSLAGLAKAYLRRLSALWRSSSFDLLWIEKECLPWLPYFVEAAFLSNVPYVLDYDDAVFHNYDLHKNAALRSFFRDRLDLLMAKASLVVVGNQYLAERARSAGAPSVHVVPTAIDLERYPLPPVGARNIRPEAPRIIWIGSPGSAYYLDILTRPLQQLARKYKFVFSLVGVPHDIPCVNTEYIPWTEATEVDSISRGYIGVMPLLDTPWERGKCGYKLIQYMACGLPVVATPVGTNCELVENGFNGFFANTCEDWASALEHLLTQPDLRVRMGVAGRALFEQKYCIQVTGPKLVALFKKVSKAN